MVGDGRDLITPDKLAGWSRYGMEPFNWIIDDELLASVYPVDLEYVMFLKNEMGIGTVINLTESPWPEDWIQISGIRHEHFPIVDMSIPKEEEVVRMLDIIGTSEGPLMIHCAAGIGRTGTIMALYLVEKGMDPEKAIAYVRQKRNGSIQTPAQEQLVHHWARRRM